MPTEGGGFSRHQSAARSYSGVRPSTGSNQVFRHQYRCREDAALDVRNRDHAGGKIRRASGPEWRQRGANQGHRLNPGNDRQ